MNALEEINGLVKSAGPLDSIKPRSYFSSYTDPVYDHPSTLKAKIQSSGYQPSMVALSQNRQWVPGRSSRGVRTTGQMRTGGSAPVDTVASSSLNPFRSWRNWQGNASTKMMADANSGKTPSSMAAMKRNGAAGPRYGNRLLPGYGINGGQSGQYASNQGYTSGTRDWSRRGTSLKNSTFGLRG